MNPALTDAIARLAQAQKAGSPAETNATLVLAQAVIAVATELKLTREAV